MSGRLADDAMWVRPLADADRDATCGGKARGLARLLAAGLPVPDGFVIDARAFEALAGPRTGETPDEIGHGLAAAADRIARFDDDDAALPPAFVAEVTRRAAELGPRLAVRSSATIEDTAAGSGAGVFSSVTAVAQADLWPAIRAVWTSALTPLAAAYARRRTEAISIGVIVQRFVPGRRVTIYTRTPGAPRGPDALVQRGDQAMPRARAALDRELALAVRAEQAIAATTGADVELIVDDATPWIVQARAIVHPPPPARVPPPPALLAPLVADGRRWTWDVTHNPDALSPAQAGLVERVERAGIAPWSLRTCAGYLYSAPRGAAPSIPVGSRAELETRAAAIEGRLAHLLADDDLELAPAIARYLEVYEIWANELVPLIASARRGLAPEQLVGARPSAVETTLLAAARGELDEAAAVERLGLLSPTWDIAYPTFRERPEVIREAIARAAARPRANATTVVTGDGDLELGRGAADLAERDDRWFARAQWLVRHALLQRAEALGIAADDIGWLELDELVRGAEISPEDARRRAAATRAAAARAGKWAMPLVVGGVVPDDDRVALHGFGSGARISGRVVRFETLACAIAVGAGDVIVTRAITPALAVFVVGCAAIISETGGLLDHGAALARELGIPFVVGCKDAWSLLHDGMIVTIDRDVVSVATTSE